MRAQDLTFVPVDVDNLQGDCQSAISVGEVDAGGSWLLGAAFLKNAYFAWVPHLLLPFTRMI